MIRIWKGIEYEGIGKESEIPTLFICATEPVSFEFIADLLQKNPEVEGLYFGAGRKEFCGLTSMQDWDRLILLCTKNKYSIVVEVSPIMLETFAMLYDASMVTFVVAYYNAPKSLNKLYFKTDDWNTTKIFTSQKNVDITEVKDDRYPEDVLIYEKED